MQLCKLRVAAAAFGQAALYMATGCSAVCLQGERCVRVSCRLRCSCTGHTALGWRMQSIALCRGGVLCEQESIVVVRESMRALGV